MLVAVAGLYLCGEPSVERADSETQQNEIYSDSNWTKEDKAVLERHFIRFQEAIKSGQLILAGRTNEAGEKTFGIAIFEASDEAAARAFMQADPAVAGGLMIAELHPFAVALERKNP